jgi:hypothetical protein
MCGSGQSKTFLSEKKLKNLWHKDERCALEITLSNKCDQDSLLSKPNSTYEIKLKYPSFLLEESKILDFSKIETVFKGNSAFSSKSTSDLRQTYDTEILSSVQTPNNNNSLSHNIRLYKQESKFNQEFYIAFKNVR